MQVRDQLPDHPVPDGIRDVLALAQPLEQARFVSVSSGGYSVSVPLSDASGVLLCDTLNESVPVRGTRWSVAAGCAERAVLLPA